MLNPNYILMYLYYITTIQDFIDALQVQDGQCLFRMRLNDILTQTYQTGRVPYGILLFQDAMKRYEKLHAIPPHEQKSRMPLLRKSQFRLVGPDCIPFAATLTELRPNPQAIGEGVCVAFDYYQLVNYCLSEDISIFRKKYNDEQAVKGWLQVLEKEYDKIFYDEEHTGFMASSQYIPLLLKAVLEMRPDFEAAKKEWHISVLKSSEEADYEWKSDMLQACVHLDIPYECLHHIEWLQYARRPQLYTPLIGYMKKKGFVPEQLLTSLQEENV